MSDLARLDIGSQWKDKRRAFVSHSWASCFYTEWLFRVPGILRERPDRGCSRPAWLMFCKHIQQGAPRSELYHADERNHAERSLRQRNEQTIINKRNSLTWLQWKKINDNWPRLTRPFWVSWFQRRTDEYQRTRTVWWVHSRSDSVGHLFWTEYNTDEWQTCMFHVSLCAQTAPTYISMFDVIATLRLNTEVHVSCSTWQWNVKKPHFIQLTFRRAGG